MKKFIAVFINIIAATIVIISLTLIQNEYPKDTVFEVLTSPPFEETSNFSNIMNEKIDTIFSLITLKNCFEKNGELDYNIVIAESLDAAGESKQWTIQECLDEAIAHGLYIDVNYDIQILSEQNTKAFSRNIIYNFLYKIYPSNAKTGASTEEEFLTEFMSLLSKYHQYNYSLNLDNTNFNYKMTYYDEDNVASDEYFNTKLSDKEMLNSSAFIYVSNKDNIISSNIYRLNSPYALRRIKSNNPFTGKNFTLYCSVDTNYPQDDEFKANYNSYTENKNHCAILVTTFIYSTIAFIISLLIDLLILLSTKKNVDEADKIIHSIPTEFYFVLYVLFIISLFFITNSFIDSSILDDFDKLSVQMNAYIFIVYATTVLLLNILASKYTNDTLTPVFLKAIRDNSDNSDNSNVHYNSRLMFAIIYIPIIVLIVLSIFLIYLYSMNNIIQILISGIIMLVAVIIFVIYLLFLQSAFNKALEVQVKSNEMRTSLIANVSHDIKTPLTSILNYTNLISEEIKNPTKSMIKNLESYSETIVNKSYRLNDLINDLIFDSKVSSGNVELNMEKLDLNAFITQVITEFESRLSEKNIKVVYNNTSSKSTILADSSQLYRVFQNLFSNIFKYALDNSRVFIDLYSIKSKIFVVIKNIQKEKIEVDPGTLKDRFVRGNKSRTTEGFGLGLSISENLIKSMNGKLEITSLQDLFTVKITFVAYEE